MLVQYLLLMSQYLQGTVKSVQTWAIHGLAVKAALSLGLHSTDAARRFSPIEREMRKRIWCGCVMLDRYVSFPEDIVGHAVTFPQKSEHDIRTTKCNTGRLRSTAPSHLAGRRTWNSRLTGQLHGHKCTLLLCLYLRSVNNRVAIHSFDTNSMHRTLYKVQWRVIHSLYGQNLGCDQPLGEMETITEVFKLEQELSEWEHSLVQPLCFRTPATVLLDQESALDERFRVILTLRYLNLQILLHRPFLSRCLYLRSKSSTENQTVRSADHFAASSIDTCIRSSENMISIVHSIVSAKPSLDLLGAWWFSLYYSKQSLEITSELGTDGLKHSALLLSSSAAR
jgi:hypothetical protein